MKTRISAIVAANLDWVIGDAGEIPWRISADLKRFKRLTLDCPLIMGRKTYESIGRPLPRRKNIVLTRDTSYRAPGCFLAHSAEEALELAREEDPREIFVGGGEGVYETLMPWTDRVYLTVVHLRGEGDTRFPGLHEAGWRVASWEHHVADGGTPAFTTVDLDRVEGEGAFDPGAAVIPSAWAELAPAL